MASAWTSDDSSDGSHLTIWLENAHTRIAIIPEVAGKIVELTDRRSGRNWLWSNPALPLGKRSYGSSFDAELDSGGWDDILLSVTPEHVELPDGKRCKVPDHGDLVGQAWILDDFGVDPLGNPYCALTASGKALDYAWRRTVVLESDRPLLRLHYLLENTGSSCCPWFWCAHPLIAVEEGMHIHLAPGQEFFLAGTHGLSVANRHASMRWPWLPIAAGQSINLSNCFETPQTRTGFAAKIFVRSALSGRVSIGSADGQEQLTLRYNGKRIPWLGLWFNNRGWSGSAGAPYLNLGLEPSTVPCDSLAQALAMDQLEFLRPGERQKWSLEVRLQAREAAAPRTEAAT